MPKQDLVSIQVIADLLNYSVEEIEDLCDQKKIPHLIFNGGTENEIKSFPKQEVLATITPRKVKPKKPKVEEEPKAEETPAETPEPKKK